MHRKYHILLLCLLITIASRAQSDEEFVTFTQEVNIPKTEALESLILIDDSLPAVITRYGDALLLRKFYDDYGDDPYLLFSQPKRRLIGYQKHGNDLTVLARRIGDSLKRYSLIEMSMRRDSVLVHQETHFNLSKDGQRSNKNQLYYHLSPDGQYTLVCQQEAFKAGKKAIVNLYVQSADTSVHLHVPLSFSGDDAMLQGASIDDRGVVFFAVQTGVMLNSPFRKKHLIYSFDPFEKVLVEFDMSNPDFFTQDMLIHTNDSGLYVISLYSGDPLVEDKSNGYSFVATSSNGRDINTRMGGAFSAQALEVHNQYENDAGSYISDLIISGTIEIGNAPYVVFEKRYHDQICTADPSTGIVQCTEQYHFNGLSFESPLKPGRSITLRKRQLDYDQPGSFSGYSMLRKDGFAWVFYNDHYKNQGTSAERIMNNASRSIMRFVRVDELGKLTSGKMQTERQSDFAFTPKTGMVQNNQMAYYLLKDGDLYKVGKFDFSKLSALSQGFN